MRNLLIGILLAGAAVTPALAQDNNADEHRRHDQQQSSRGDGQQQRPAPPQQDRRGPRPNGGSYNGQQQMPQWAHDQRQMQVQQGQGAGARWDRGRFQGQNGMPQPQTPQQLNGYRAPGEADRARGSGWMRSDAGRQNEAAQRGGWYGQRGGAQPQYRNGNGYAGENWNRDWRRDQRYDWRQYRDSHRSTFHIGLYVDPFGYGYRSFAVGYRLPPVYFGQRYWIDPGMFDLPYPPPGTAWVRYWNDALLVDVYSGEVVDAIQGFFW